MSPAKLLWPTPIQRLPLITDHADTNVFQTSLISLGRIAVMKEKGTIREVNCLEDKTKSELLPTKLLDPWPRAATTV